MRVYNVANENSTHFLSLEFRFFAAAFRLHLHGTHHENGNFPFPFSSSCRWKIENNKTTQAIQFVTEINSESNHQYSMFASYVRSHNRKLTTLHRALREFLWDEKKTFFWGFPFGHKFATANEKKIVCGERSFLTVDCLTCKVIS